MEMMSRLEALGVEFSLDDFGTGYSSLDQLRRLPVGTLKIDRSFVMAMHESEADMEVVRSIVSLGHGLSRQVVAEGVECEEHLTRLAEFGCDLAQGYYLSAPITAAELVRWLHDRKDPAVAACKQTDAGGSEAHSRRTAAGPLRASWQ